MTSGLTVVAAPRVQEGPMAQGKVLVVEDEPEVAEILAYNLERQGFQTLRAGDGLEACRLIGDEHPDAVILDLLLPNLDGREVCRLLRGHPDEAVASTPILMLTALGGPADRVRGLSLGADDYLAKPFSVEEVVLRIGRLVGRRRATSELRDELDRRERRESSLLELQDMLFHELKNQVLVIKGHSHRVGRDDGLLPADKVRSYAAAIHRSSSYLSAVAEDVLLLHQLEADRLELTRDEVDLGELVEIVLSAHAEAATAKGTKLTGEPELAGRRLRLNRTAAKIVLSCLVENAIKYGGQEGVVRVGYRELPCGGELVVADEGPGIPEDEQDRVFEKLYRGASNRATQGTGLGLYFVKTLTRAMGGGVELESEVGRGSRFRVLFPFES